MNRQRGIALILVLSAISLLTIIMVSFSFDSKINLINANNMQNRAQAKINAESGLRWSLLMLDIYRELFNKLEQHEQAKAFFPPDSLNFLWNTPFIFPLPPMGQLSSAQQDALNEFNDKSFLQGEFNVSVKNLSGRLNLNLLGFSIYKIASQGKLQLLHDGDYYQEQEESPTFAKNFKKMLDNAIQQKVETDYDNRDQYSGINTEELVNNLIYYLTDPMVESISPCPGCQEATQAFNNYYIVAKKAPMTSLSELYLVPGWSHTIIELIQNNITAYGAFVIDLTEITADILKMLIPELNQNEISEFYKYKNSPESIETFNTIESIKKYFQRNTAHSFADFDKRVKELEKAGLQFGSSPSIFEVKSVGKVDRTTYSISAIVSLPVLPSPKPVTKKQQGNSGEIPMEEVPINTENPQEEKNKKKELKRDIVYPVQLLKPRVIHLSIN